MEEKQQNEKNDIDDLRRADLREMKRKDRLQAIQAYSIMALLLSVCMILHMIFYDDSISKVELIIAALLALFAWFGLKKE